MNTPGFTAHNSLYQSNRHYVAGLISSWIPSATVVPLFIAPIKFPQGEGGDCHETCGPCLGNCTKSCTNTCYGEAPPYEKACCASTQTCCSGECFNTTSDAKNCGVCGKACPGGWFCVDGVCQPCKPGLTLCDGDCVNTKSNGANCGACGKECTGGRECIDGRCKCPGNSTFCGDVTTVALVALGAQAVAAITAFVACPAGPTGVVRRACCAFWESAFSSWLPFPGFYTCISPKFCLDGLH